MADDGKPKPEKTREEQMREAAIPVEDAASDVVLALTRAFMANGVDPTSSMARVYSIARAILICFEGRLMDADAAGAISRAQVEEIGILAGGLLHQRIFKRAPDNRTVLTISCSPEEAERILALVVAHLGDRFEAVKAAPEAKPHLSLVKPDGTPVH